MLATLALVLAIYDIATRSSLLDNLSLVCIPQNNSNFIVLNCFHNRTGFPAPALEVIGDTFFDKLVAMRCEEMSVSFVDKPAQTSHKLSRESSSELMRIRCERGPEK